VDPSWTQAPSSRIRRYSVIAVPARPSSRGYGYDPARAALLPTSLAAALDALEADHELADVLGGYFAASFVAYQRNEIERFELYVTDWEYREYAYHL
jgi:glutamine synthetase